MRNLVVAGCLLVGACAFEPGDFSEGDRPTGGGPTGTGTGSGSDPSPTPRRTCAYDNTTLKLCLDFEDAVFDPMVTDASANRLDSPTNDVGRVMRDGGTKVAAAFSPFSRIDVPESLALDISGSITIEMWVYPVAFGVPANLLQNFGQYRLELDDDDQVVCTIGSRVATSVGDINPYRWSHIACMYDGSNVSIFIDGNLSAKVSASSGAPINGTMGTRIGSSYSGHLDDIRVYAGALPATDVCTHAGRTSCSGSVIDSGGGGGGGPGG